MAGSIQNEMYLNFAAMLPSRDYVFMNHGFSDPAGNDDFSSLEPIDLPQKYSVNLLRHILKGLPLAGKRVLEVGSGRGGNCAYLARQGVIEEATGVDFCSANVDFCNRVHRLPKLRFIQGDSQDLPFEDSSFDIVLNIESSHCYPDLGRFFSEVRRVLRPGGHFSYTDVIFEEQRLDRIEFVEKSGFTHIKFEDITLAVARALERDSENVTALLRNMIEPELKNETVVESLIDGLTRVAPQGYLSGQACYYHWKLGAP